jgi:hypothetical protein
MRWRPILQTGLPIRLPTGLQHRNLLLPDPNLLCLQLGDARIVCGSDAAF